MNDKLTQTLKHIAIAIAAGGLIAALGIVANIDPASGVSARDISIALASAFVTGCARAAQLLIPDLIAQLRDAMKSDTPAS